MPGVHRRARPSPAAPPPGCADLILPKALASCLGQRLGFNHCLHHVFSPANAVCLQAAAYAGIKLRSGQCKCNRIGWRQLFTVCKLLCSDAVVLPSQLHNERPICSVYTRNSLISQVCKSQLLSWVMRFDCALRHAGIAWAMTAKSLRARLNCNWLTSHWLIQSSGELLAMLAMFSGAVYALKIQLQALLSVKIRLPARPLKPAI